MYSSRLQHTYVRTYIAQSESQSIYFHLIEYQMKKTTRTTVRQTSRVLRFRDGKMLIMKARYRLREERCKEEENFYTKRV